MSWVKAVLDNLKLVFAADARIDALKDFEDAYNVAQNALKKVTELQAKLFELIEKNDQLAEKNKELCASIEDYRAELARLRKTIDKLKEKENAKVG